MTTAQKHTQEVVQPAEQVKTVSKRWRESGKIVPFKEFAEDFNRKKKFLNASGPAATSAPAPPYVQQPSVSNGQLFGLPKIVVYGSVLLIVGGIIFVIVKRSKK